MSCPASKSSSLPEVERLEWSAAESFYAYGARFGLRTNDPRGLAEARSHLPLGWQAAEAQQVDQLYSLHLASSSGASDASSNHLLYAGTTLIARSPDAQVVYKSLAEHALQSTMWSARDHLFVHAGVVGWRGRAILIPGRSFSGKTTLTKALVGAGASFYSDEFAVLDRRGLVHPYPLPLSIRAGNGHPTKTVVEQLGGQHGAEPLAVGLIVVTRYRRRARWRPLELSPAQAMLALMDNTVAARREPEYSMPILRETVLQARCIKSNRGEAARLAPTLLDLVRANDR
jgi:hypothetical protein